MPCVRLFKLLHIIYRLYLHDFSDYSLISPFLIIRKIIRKGVNRIGENCKSAQFNLSEHRSWWSTELTTVNSVQCLCITKSVGFFSQIYMYSIHSKTVYNPIEMLYHIHVLSAKYIISLQWCQRRKHLNVIYHIWA